jgi:hypothetical protein
MAAVCPFDQTAGRSWMMAHPHRTGKDSRPHGSYPAKHLPTENPQMSDPNHSLADAGLVRQALDEHGVRFFPRFDIIEIVKNSVFGFR